jgi:hypothetical protein
VRSRSALANGRSAWVSYAPENAPAATAYRDERKNGSPKYEGWMLLKTAGEWSRILISWQGKF